VLVVVMVLVTWGHTDLQRGVAGGAALRQPGVPQRLARAGPQPGVPLQQALRGGACGVCVCVRVCVRV
jgi:hypothetical protein